MTYGRGRAEQFRLHPTPGSALNFVPPLFLVYLVALVAEPWVGTILLAPLGLYGIAVLAQAVVLRVHGPQSTVHGPQSTVHGPQSTVHGPQSTVEGSKYRVPSPESQVQSPRLGIAGGLWRRIAMIPLIVLTHVLYGAGFWRGLFTKLGRDAPRQPYPVVLETIAP